MIGDRPTHCRRTLSIAILFLFLMVAGCGNGGNGVQAAIGGGTDGRQTVERTDPRPNIIVVLTDDQGYADLGAQGVVDDIQTPHIDRLAQQGIRMTAGYATAPQCTPSRAGLISGRYQQRFGLEDNTHTPMPLSTDTIAQRLQDCGYATGFVGKWHLDIDNGSLSWFAENYPAGDVQNFVADDLPIDIRRSFFPDSRGFGDVYFGYLHTYWRNLDLNGQHVTAGYTYNGDFRVDVISNAALAFIDRHKASPFFLVVSYYGPHVPLEAPNRYLQNFPTNMPERRRYSLAMMSAIDAGVGAIMGKLNEYELENDTLIFFISDNGAPLGIDMEDVSIADASGVWNGSLNDPWIGEKGMLSEAGIRIPFIVRWKGALPEGKEFHGAVSTLDVGATALSLAESQDVDDLDGIDLIPILKGDAPAPEERTLFWRFWDQVAIRKGGWKYLLAGSHEFLFNLDHPNHEYVNVIAQNPDLASQLKFELTQWAHSMQRSRMTRPKLTGQESVWYDAYFDVPSTP